MNKIKKFKKSKKTNNKRNNKRRRMTRKLRGGTKELEKIFQEHDNETRPIIERINQIVSTGELREETQGLEGRINEIQQVTREDYDILRDKIDVLTENVGGLLKIKDNETMVPLLFKLGTNEVVFINKNITAFTAQNVPVRNVINGGPDYISYLLDLYQLLKFKRLQKIDFNIIQSFRILLPGLDENGMPNIIWGGRSREDARSRNRKIISLFEDLENFNSSEIKYIYLNANAPRDGPIEYDLEGLKRILIQDGLLDRE